MHSIAENHWSELLSREKMNQMATGWEPTVRDPDITDRQEPTAGYAARSAPDKKEGEERREKAG